MLSLRAALRRLRNAVRFACVVVRTSSTGISGESPVAGVTIGVYANSNETTAVGTNAQGDYSVTVTTNGQALDGFVKATKSG